MNRTISVFGWLACAAILATSGCSKSENAATTPPTPAAPQEKGAAQKVVATAQAQTEVVRQKAVETVANAQAQAGATVSKTQGLLDQAKTSISQGKWTEALALLNQLNGQNLSPEQQSMLQSLKDQAQKGAASAAQAGAASEAKKAAGNLLPGAK